MLEQLQNELESLKEKQDNAKNLAREVLSDSSIDLETRLKLWTKLPAEIKEHKTFYSSEIDEALNKFLGDSDWTWYDKFYVDRYQTVDIGHLLIERIPDQQDMEIGEEMLCPEYRELVETVLQLNIASFVYDW